MALPDSLKITVGTAIVLANSGDHAPAANNNLGTQTVQIDLTSLGANAYRQSDKFDFGANRAPSYFVMAALEFLTTPVAGEVVNFYLAYSPSTTAAVANPGNVSGVDGAYTGYSSNPADAIQQTEYIGSFIATVQATTTIVKAHIGVFTPRMRYASLIVHNNTAGDAFVADAVEMSVLISPNEEQIQD